MPLVYIHGVRHREPKKLLRMKRKLEDVVKTLGDALPQPFDVRVPYWGEFGASQSIQGLLPLDAPFAEGTGGHENASPDDPPAKPDSLEVLRDVGDDNEVRMRKLLEDQIGEEPITAEERAELERLLHGNWQEAYVQERERRAAQPADENDDLELERVEDSPAIVNQDLVRQRNLAQRLFDLVERTASQLSFDNAPARAWLRGMQDSCALFLGDAMTYVMQREARGADSPILRTVLAAFPESRARDEKLIVVTHSMGAAIVYDVLTKFRTDLHVDCWISVGSQVGQFASLGLLAQQKPLAPGERIDALADRVTHWRNVYDRLDFLNFLTEPAFTNARDIEYSNRRGPAVSHSWYFKEQPFWDLVSKLIADALADAKK